MNEHLSFSDHHLRVHLSLLFTAMLRYSFVPDDFCKGIIVPLLKSKHGDASTLDMHRGITLSPVLSKVLEAVLLRIYKDYLTLKREPKKVIHLRAWGSFLTP